MFNYFSYCLFFLLSAFIFSSPVIATQTETPPTLQQILDPSVPWGINLNLIDRRQRIMRKSGIADDFSTKIVLYQGNKSIMKKLVNERVDLSKQIEAIQTELAKKLAAVSAINILKKNSLKKEAEKDLVAPQKRIKEIDEKLANYKNVNKNLINNIMTLTKLSSEKVGRIPDLENWRNQ